MGCNAMARHTILILIIALTLAACLPQPTPTPPPATPVPTATPTVPPTWLLDCKVDKCPVFVATGVNDSGYPLIALNTGVYFVLGDRIQFHFPCIEADGGTVWCEVYRDADGNYYPAGRYIRRDKLARVY